MGSKVEQRLHRRMARYEVNQLMKEKRSEEMESLEEVFDKSTLMTIYRMINHGDIRSLNGVVRSGKEARIYWGLREDNRPIAVKIYLTTSSIFRKGMLMYVQGDPRFANVRMDTRSLIKLWAMKEFRNLTQAREAGVHAPTPYKVENNILLMEFIGTPGTPAPLLREKPLDHPAQVFDAIAEQVKLLYRKAQLVHGDLSEYNIMMKDDLPIIIDWAQAVPPEHPSAQVFLDRDLKRLIQYFSEIGVTAPSLEKFRLWVTD